MYITITSNSVKQYFSDCSILTLDRVGISLGMKTSSNGNIFHATGPLCGEFNGHRWIPLIKTSDAELWSFIGSVTWINGWVNTREGYDLRHNRAHHDVISMGWELAFRYRIVSGTETKTWLLLNDKMVPLTEDQGVGVGGAWEPPLVHGLTHLYQFWI